MFVLKDYVHTKFSGVLDRLLVFMPRERQIMLYSATFPKSVTFFMHKYMRNPFEINMMNELTLLGITQYYATSRRSRRSTA